MHQIFFFSFKEISLNSWKIKYKKCFVLLLLNVVLSQMTMVMNIFLNTGSFVFSRTCDWDDFFFFFFFFFFFALVHILSKHRCKFFLYQDREYRSFSLFMLKDLGLPQDPAKRHNWCYLVPFYNKHISCIYLQNLVSNNIFNGQSF